MNRHELLTNLREICRQARDLTGCYSAADAKQAKRTIAKTNRLLKRVIGATSDKALERSLCGQSAVLSKYVDAEGRSSAATP